MKIPRILLQTSTRHPTQNVIAQLQFYAKDWKYQFFTDSTIVDFFIKNPHPEFPNIVAKFLSMSKGAHKSDLFRYYFLYLNGGVFLDSDAMFEINIDEICQNYDFISVNSSYVPDSIFQGLIGCVPKNRIIYYALKDMYNISNFVLDNDYHIVCKNLYTIIFSLEPWVRENNFQVKLYNEKVNDDNSAKICESDTTLCIHYYKHKRIPEKQLIPTPSNKSKKNVIFSLNPRSLQKMPLGI